MRDINLLPWRETNKRGLQRRFYRLALLSFMLPLMVFGFVHFYLIQEITLMKSVSRADHQKAQQIAAAVKTLKMQIQQQQQLTAVSNWIDSEKQDQKKIFNILNRAAACEQVHFYKIERNENIIFIEGKSFSEKDLQIFINEVREFAVVNIKKIRNSQRSSEIYFQIEASINENKQH